MDDEPAKDKKCTPEKHKIDQCIDRYDQIKKLLMPFLLVVFGINLVSFLTFLQMAYFYIDTLIDISRKNKIRKYKFFLYTVLNLVVLSNVRYNVLEFIPFEVET